MVDTDFFVYVGSDLLSPWSGAVVEYLLVVGVVEEVVGDEDGNGVGGNLSERLDEEINVHMNE